MYEDVLVKISNFYLTVNVIDIKIIEISRQEKISCVTKCECC